MSIDVFPTTVLNSTLWNGQTYEEGTFTVTGTGFTTTVTGTATYVKIGKQVTLALPSLSGTSNATTFTLTGLPAAVTPGVSAYVAFSGVDNGTSSVSPALLVITSGSAVFTLYRSFLAAAWTASGTKTMGQVVISYLTA